MKQQFRIDLHMHSTISDGTDSPEEIISHVRDAGITFFALSDHDSLKGCGIIRSLLEKPEAKEEPALRFVNGVEFSCRDELGKYHILGYGYDPEGASISALAQKGHSLRMNKLRARLEFIRSSFGFDFPKEEVDRLFALDNPGKPHIGNLMVKYGYADSKESAIRDYLDQLHLKSEYVRPEEAVSAIIGSGGIPVLAHPFFGSGDQLIVGDEMNERLKRLTGFGLQGVESYYSGFTPKLIKEMLAFAEHYDLYTTAGSDYHGKNKLVVLGDTGLPADEPLPKRLVSFIEELEAGKRVL